MITESLKTETNMATQKSDTANDSLKESQPKENPKGVVTFSIREMCREFETTSRTLRFYEDKGILSPERKGTARIYYPRDRARLSLALKGKRIGISLEKIAELLNLYDLKEGKVKQMEEALVIFREQIKLLEQQKIDIEQTLNDLISHTNRVEDELKTLKTK